jgi:class 3 adenylate cyclase
MHAHCMAGDAYIAAAWLPCPGGQGSAASSRESRQILNKMLWLAGVMLQTLRDYRERHGKAIHCRIGIASGMVFAGASSPCACKAPVLV